MSGPGAESGGPIVVGLEGPTTHGGHCAGRPTRLGSARCRCERCSPAPSIWATRRCRWSARAPRAGAPPRRSSTRSWPMSRATSPPTFAWSTRQRRERCSPSLTAVPPCWWWAPGASAGSRSLLLGSVSEQCARHAIGTVVVPAAAPTEVSGPEVVGVDGSEAPGVALDRAIDEAALRQVHLTAIGSWWDPGWSAVMGHAAVANPYSEMQADCERLLREEVDRAMARAARRPPDTGVIASGRSAVEALVGRAAKRPAAGRGEPQARRVRRPAARLGQPGMPRHAPGAVAVVRARAKEL